MLRLSGVSLRRGRKLLFENVNLQAAPGQRIGVIGANGSGKTSLFLLLLGELEADAGDVHLARGWSVAHVAQESPGGNHSALEHVLDGDRELRGIQSAIRQAEEEPGTASTHALYERMEEIDGFAAEARASRLLDGLGFSPADHARPVDAFSGGWKMRLNLAQALMCRSDLLLLDEPTNHLDLPAILWLEQWLRRYSGVLLLISHDRDFLDAVCSHTAHIEQEAMRVRSGNYSQFERQRAEQLAQQQALFRRQQKEIRHIQSYVDRFRYKASKARQAQSRLKMLERMTRIAPAHVDSPFRFAFEAPDRLPRHLLQLESVEAGYTEPVLREVDLLIHGGDRIGLLGANGAGKSTLVKALANGSTLLGGRRTPGRDTRIGYFAQQQLDHLEPSGSPCEHLARLVPGWRESELRNYLGRFGFGGDRIFEAVAPFSGGEKARLLLALLIVQKPNLLLLDEPTNHLDLEMRQALGMALTDYGGALLLISHDRHLLRSVCDELLLVDDGRVRPFDGSLDDYADWLREQQLREGGGREPGSRQAPVNRKRQRQDEARRRRQLKPLRDRVRDIETRLERCRTALAELEERLGDGSLYEASRKDELTALIRDQAGLKSQLGELESAWLEASEALEQAAETA